MFDLVFAHILRRLLHFVKHLFGYRRYRFGFALDEIEVENSTHDLPLHLPLTALGK